MNTNMAQTQLQHTLCMKLHGEALLRKITTNNSLANGEESLLTASFHLFHVESSNSLVTLNRNSEPGAWICWITVTI